MILRTISTLWDVQHTNSSSEYTWYIYEIFMAQWICHCRCGCACMSEWMNKSMFVCLFSKRNILESVSGSANVFMFHFHCWKDQKPTVSSCGRSVNVNAFDMKVKGRKNKELTHNLLQLNSIIFIYLTRVSDAYLYEIYWLVYVCVHVDVSGIWCVVGKRGTSIQWPLVILHVHA